MTLAVIKPDGVQKGLVEKIKRRYEKAGLKINFDKQLTLCRRQAEELYAEHKGTSRFEGCVLAITSGPVHALCVSGVGAAAVVRKLNGHWDPSQAAMDTIRRDFPSAGGPFNIVHASDSQSAAEREISIVFADSREKD